MLVTQIKNWAVVIKPCGGGVLKVHVGSNFQCEIFIDHLGMSVCAFTLEGVRRCYQISTQVLMTREQLKNHRHPIPFWVPVF